MKMSPTLPSKISGQRAHVRLHREVVFENLELNDGLAVDENARMARLLAIAKDPIDDFDRFRGPFEGLVKVVRRGLGVAEGFGTLAAKRRVKVVVLHALERLKHAAVALSAPLNVAISVAIVDSLHGLGAAKHPIVVVFYIAWVDELLLCMLLSRSKSMLV